MNVHGEYVPRTMHHHEIKSKDKERAKIAGHIEMFKANGGEIEKVGSGLTPFDRRPSKERNQVYNSAITNGNKARREEKKIKR